MIVINDSLSRNWNARNARIPTEWWVFVKVQMTKQEREKKINLAQIGMFLSDMLKTRQRHFNRFQKEFMCYLQYSEMIAFSAPFVTSPFRFFPQLHSICGELFFRFTVQIDRIVSQINSRKFVFVFCLFVSNRLLLAPSEAEASVIPFISWWCKVHAIGCIICSR